MFLENMTIPVYKTSYPSRALEFNHVDNGVRVARSLGNDHLT